MPTFTVIHIKYSYTWTPGRLANTEHVHPIATFKERQPARNRSRILNSRAVFHTTHHGGYHGSYFTVIKGTLPKAYHWRSPNPYRGPRWD